MLGNFDKSCCCSWANSIHELVITCMAHDETAVSHLLQPTDMTRMSAAQSALINSDCQVELSDNQSATSPSYNYDGSVALHASNTNRTGSSANEKPVSSVLPSLPFVIEKPKGKRNRKLFLLLSDKCAQNTLRAKLASVKTRESMHSWNLQFENENIHRVSLGDF